MSKEPSRDESDPASPDRTAGARILARSFYRELRSSGYSPMQLVAISTELIELVTVELRNDREKVKSAA